MSDERNRAILREQFRTLRHLIPLMYAMMMIDAAFLSFASFGRVRPELSIGVPLFLVLAGAMRALFWIRRRAFFPDDATIRRYLIGTTISSAVLSIGFGGWGLYLYGQADLIQRMCIALYIFIGAMSCCYCLQSLPRASHFVLLFGATPVTVCLLASSDWFLRGVGANTLIVSLLVLRMLRTSHAGFIEVVTSRSEMAAEQQRALGAEQRAHQLAYHDPLTGLPNRRALAEALESRPAIVRGGDRFGLLIVDLDRFKAVNDVHGHPAGDALLREVAERLNGVSEGRGRAYRMGGDEFAVVVDALDVDGEGARRIARRIVHAMAQPFRVGDRVHHIGASVGIALYPQDASDRETLMRRADVALYQAKQSGRSQHCAFEPVLDAEIRRRAAIESELRVAIARDEFVPHYQPIVELATGATVAYELLARWPRESEREIGPDQFIPIAEECGLIDELMMGLLARACADTRAWENDVTIAINVSPVQLQDPWLSQRILAVLLRERFPPKRLSIEITENALIVDAENAQQTIASLKNQGIQVALDDFGTGYSSLQHLHMLPFDKLKIDRSFVMAMESDREALKIVRAIISLAATLDLPVVAEGIENARTAQRLRTLGCTLGQGFHFGVPMSKADVEAEMARSAIG